MAPLCYIYTRVERGIITGDFTWASLSYSSAKSIGASAEQIMDTGYGFIIG